MDINVSELSMAALDVQSQDYDWSEGYPEKWEFLRDPENDEDEGPMMNYFYALPDTRTYGEEDRKAIEHLPLCIIEWQRDSGLEGYALALTGGGMDLSWEICEAFIRLGFLPPTHFAGRLPAMCGRGVSEKDKLIAEACRRSIRSEMGYLEGALKTIDHAVEFGDGHARKVAAEQKKAKRKPAKKARR